MCLNRRCVPRCVLDVGLHVYLPWYMATGRTPGAFVWRSLRAGTRTRVRVGRLGSLGTQVLTLTAHRHRNAPRHRKRNASADRGQSSDTQQPTHQHGFFVQRDHDTGSAVHLPAQRVHGPPQRDRASAVHQSGRLRGAQAQRSVLRKPRVQSTLPRFFHEKTPDGRHAAHINSSPRQQQPALRMPNMRGPQPAVMDRWSWAARCTNATISACGGVRGR